MTTRMTINGVSTCAEAGTEKYERFQSGIGRRRRTLVQYDYRHPIDRELFSCVKPTLDECRACLLYTSLDINRMKFRQMDLKKGCKNLMRMFENEEIYTFIAQEYARSRHFDPQQCKAWIHYYNHLSLKRDYRKKKFKAFKKRFF